MVFKFCIVVILCLTFLWSCGQGERNRRGHENRNHTTDLSHRNRFDNTSRVITGKDILRNIQHYFTSRSGEKVNSKKSKSSSTSKIHRKHKHRISQTAHSLCYTPVELHIKMLNIKLRCYRRFEFTSVLKKLSGSDISESVLKIEASMFSEQTGTSTEITGKINVIDIILYQVRHTEFDLND